MIEQKWTTIIDQCKSCGKPKKPNTYMNCYECTMKKKNSQDTEPNHEDKKPSYEKIPYKKKPSSIQVPLERISHCLRTYEECFNQVMNSEVFKQFPESEKKDIATTIYIQVGRR